MATLWGLGGYEALGRGVFTPRGERLIVLFVTRERESWMTDYDNFLEDGFLLWDGQEGHGTDQRIVRAAERGEEIHLFYRQRRHMPFTYHGPVLLLLWELHADRPSEFVFSVGRVAAAADQTEPATTTGLAEDPAAYTALSPAGASGIDRYVLAKSRGLAQTIFRRNLLRMWGGSCAVTGVQEPRVLRSSHIKPWKEASVPEKVDRFNGLPLVPNLDALFNEGLISFRDRGQIIVSTDWRPEDQRRMQITSDLALRASHPEMRRYLEYHRDVVLRT